MGENYIYLIYIMNLKQQQQRLTSPLIFRWSNLSSKRSSLVRIAIFRTVIKLFVAKSPLPCSFSSRLCIQLVQISICHLVHQSYSKLAFLFHLFECRLSSSRYLFLSCDTKTANKYVCQDQLYCWPEWLPQLPSAPMLPEIGIFLDRY